MNLLNITKRILIMFLIFVPVAGIIFLLSMLLPQGRRTYIEDR